MADKDPPVRDAGYEPSGIVPEEPSGPFLWLKHPHFVGSKITRKDGNGDGQLYYQTH